MLAKLQRPLLIGGAATVLGMWGISTLGHALGEWGTSITIAAAIGTGIWWLERQSTANAVQLPTAQPVDLATVRRTLAEAEQVINQLQVETDDPEPAAQLAKPQVSLLQTQASQIVTEMERETLRLLVMGAQGTGKTTLIQLLQLLWADQSPRSVTFTETSSLLAEMPPDVATAAMVQHSLAADLVLFLVTGDLTESERQLLQQLAAQKRTLVVFGKQDQYLPAERSVVLARIQERVQRFLDAADVVAVTADPVPLKVRQHQADGAVQEWLEDQVPHLAPLTQRLEQILSQEGEQLVLASSLGYAAALKVQARLALNEVRRARALPIVEQFQWIAAATAFASPVPTLDVVATALLNTQMILDLGAIYQQKFSLQQAQTIAKTLGGVLLKLGLVELSTRTISSLLKTNAITYVAGGCVQGVSAAYLTRLAGLSLIEYFHTQDPALTPAEAKPLVIERLSQVVQQVFQQNQQLAFLQTFVRQAVERLLPGGQPALATPNSLTLMTPDASILGQNGTGTSRPLVDLDSTSVPSRESLL